MTCGPAASQDGATALLLAAFGGHKGTAELLLDRGADLEAKDSVSAVAACLLRDGPRRASRAGRAARRWRWRVGAWCCRRGLACEAALVGGACQKGSDGAMRCGDMRACGVAGWRYVACCGCIRWPQGHGGAAAGPGRRPGGQEQCEIAEAAHLAISLDCRRHAYGLQIDKCFANPSPDPKNSPFIKLAMAKDLIVVALVNGLIFCVCRLASTRLPFARAVRAPRCFAVPSDSSDGIAAAA